MGRILIYALLGMNILFLVVSFILYKKIKKLKAQNAIKNNLNELQQAYLETSHDIVFLKDENLKYIFVNKNFEKFNNIESSQIIGYDDFHFIDTELANLYRELDMEVLDKKTIIVNESETEDKVLRTTKFPVKLLNDHYGVGAYVEDVTEEYNNKRKLVEINHILNKSNNLLSAILESSPEIIIFALDTNYCYLSFNSKHKELMKQMWGKDIEIGMNILDFIDKEDDYVELKENIDRALKGESFKKVECYGNDRTSSPIWQNFYSPMYSNDGFVIGLTCFVLNITDRIKAEEKIAYLSYHDSLTGLYNRRFFEEELSRLDVERNLPISIIVGDMNGLKLANDIFGHAVGDQLLQKVADIIKRCCREDDIIARVGGDEFTILLPKTREEEAIEIISRVKNQFSQERVKSLKGSISMGCDTKRFMHEDIIQTLKNAEKRMYATKALDSEEVKSTTIKTIVETLHENSIKEREHARRVSLICEDIGKAMKLPEIEIKRLKKAGYLHDIGKIILNENLLKESEILNDQEKKEIRQHPITGYRILNLFDDTFDLAEGVLNHHEKWDGSGYPKGLKGNEIPKFARIISIAEAYDALTNPLNRHYKSKEEAIEKIAKQAGSKFDPDIVDIFIKMIS